MFGDAETPAEALEISVTVADAELVPAENIRLEGTGSVRHLYLTPAADHWGTTNVTVSVFDGPRDD